MRRKEREVTDFNSILEIIDECRIMRIGLADGDFPYIVPLNFAYTVSGKQLDFYIHGALSGRKYELMKRCGKFTEILVSVTGGVLHNIGQIAMASLILETDALRYYLPFLLVSGTVAGVVIGVISAIMVRRIEIR